MDNIKIHEWKLKDLQPSQFYISEKKLREIESWLNPADLSCFEPIPVKLLDGRPVMTDGHTRAVAALRAGLDAVPFVWDEDELDWELYRACVAACLERDVRSPADLLPRIISEAEYREKWDRWCDVLHADMERRRASACTGLRVIDCSETLLSAFTAGRFDLERWKAYADAALPGVKDLCLADLEEVLHAGYSWEKDFLPVLNAVARETEKRRQAAENFRLLTKRLDRRILERFHRTVDADLILYLGLCSGAGWVTPVRGRQSVLFGIEKILELDWYGPDPMTGLIFHELGHVYQGQYGVLHRQTKTPRERFLWQLFTEGIAMVFEQEIAGDRQTFHQYDSGWRQWCGEHIALIRDSFHEDLDSMTPENQRYFGDWVRFHGRGDTGYYLGACFVRFLMETEDFDRLIQWDLPAVQEGFERFMQLAL